MQNARSNSELMCQVRIAFTDKVIAKWLKPCTLISNKIRSLGNLIRASDCTTINNILSYTLMGWLVITLEYEPAPRRVDHNIKSKRGAWMEKRLDNFTESQIKALITAFEDGYNMGRQEAMKLYK